MEKKENKNAHFHKKQRDEAPAQEEQKEEQKRKRKKDGIKSDEIVDDFKKVLEEKEEMIKSLQERVLYLQADFENFKRIKNKEKQDVLKFGNEELIKAMLPVIDNLERAVEHSAQTNDTKGIREGIVIVLNEFFKVLEKFGATRIDSLGEKFDPNYHEAFFQEERNDVEPDTVTLEHQKGYLLNGRLLRPAMVSISKKSDD